MKKNVLIDEMVEQLNLQLQQENTCLRYVKCSGDGYCKNYRVTVVDRYIKSEENSYSIPSISKEFEDKVRTFFKDRFDVTDTGYSNSVVNITTWDMDYFEK